MNTAKLKKIAELLDKLQAKPLDLVIRRRCYICRKPFKKTVREIRTSLYTQRCKLKKGRGRPESGAATTIRFVCRKCSRKTLVHWRRTTDPKAIAHMYEELHKNRVGPKNPTIVTAKRTTTVLRICSS